MSKDTRLDSQGGGPRGRKRPQPGRITVQGVNDSTTQQIHTLLYAANQMIPFVSKNALRPIHNIEEILELDGGVIASGASTCIRIFNRLDEIVDDKRRWQANDALESTKQVMAGVKAQRELIESQLAESKRPCMMHRPAVGFNADQGCWVAVLEPRHGDLIPVHARGATPEEALQEFDKAFTTTVETERLKKLVAEEHRKHLQRLHKTAGEKRRNAESNTNE